MVLLEVLDALAAPLVEASSEEPARRLAAAVGRFLYAGGTPLHCLSLNRGTRKNKKLAFQEQTWTSIKMRCLVHPHETEICRVQVFAFVTLKKTMQLILSSEAFTEVGSRDSFDSRFDPPRQVL